VKSFLFKSLRQDTGSVLREPGRTPTHQNCKILKTDDFYRKKLWLFNRCSEVAESFSDTIDQNHPSGGSSGIWSRPSERFKLQGERQLRQENL
jgi:hypothetical protein